ncbi:MAG TPA: flagellar export chaperone FlgN [Spirochaetales bacterium]|nr:flagellar export chaperone FlgN [Spirochaetales bacterium]HRY55681.1 flagellar export chaperone FlgN [Spirochaetia bacterium]HRZ65912.1 flagellar export chaperone FlgN [Spirochaetia bacterium]
MDQKETVIALAAAMRAEIACFEAFVAAERSFASALRDRDWGSLQTAMELIDDITRAIAEREGFRAEAFELLRTQLGCEEEGLYRVALKVPEPERSELTDLFRKLKLAAMRARFESAAASDYANSNRELLRAVLEELFPEKKGRIYGRTGQVAQPGLDSLLLNRAF